MWSPISFPRFLPEQSGERWSSGDVLRAEHFGQIKDPRASRRISRLFLEVRLIERIDKEIPLRFFPQVVSILLRILDGQCNLRLSLIGQITLLHLDGTSA